MTACDVDGLVTNIDITNSNDPLTNANYTRLAGIDAPELYTVHFFKTTNLDHVFIKCIGRLCEVHFFLRLSVLNGSESFCKELTREDFRDPVDCHSRTLKEYWFQFTTLAPLPQTVFI